jgi:hypothetical protein
MVPSRGACQDWDGVLKAREKKAIHVIGEAGDEVKTGNEIIATIWWRSPPGRPNHSLRWTG